MPTRYLRPSRRAVLRGLALSPLILLPSYAARPAPARAEALAPPEIWLPGDVRPNEAWVAVNLSEQKAVGMLGSGYTHVALVTTGKDGWDTPEGQFRIIRRVENETMTSASLGIDDPDDQYELKDVLYTQYFTWVGHALHLNYWRPASVFGRERTSHGCVGMRLADAEYFWRFLGIGSRIVIHT